MIGICYFKAVKLMKRTGTQVRQPEREHDRNLGGMYYNQNDILCVNFCFLTLMMDKDISPAELLSHNFCCCCCFVLVKLFIISCRCWFFCSFLCFLAMASDVCL